MAHVLLFHHAQGLTDGLKAFADQLRAAGHEVTAPDLFAGRTFATVAEGVDHARGLGFSSLIEAGVAAAQELSNDLVYAGFSLGVMPAQRLAQQRPGAKGALLYHSALPIDEFGDAWPDGVPLQVHLMKDDEFEDPQEIGEIVSKAGGEFFLYEGSTHLFTDSSLDDYDESAAKLVMERTLGFLDSLR